MNYTPPTLSLIWQELSRWQGDLMANGNLGLEDGGADFVAYGSGNVSVAALNFEDVLTGAED